MINRYTALFIVAISLVCSAVHATNYYINDASTTGDVFCTAAGDAGSTGTAADPYDTFDDVAANNLAPDDTVFIDAGTYTWTSGERMLFGTDDFGSAGQELVVKGAGMQKTFITNSGAHYLVEFQSDALDYIIIEDMNIYNTSSIPIYCNQGDNNTIQRCSVRTSAANAAIVLFNNSWDNVIQDCYIIDEGSMVYGIEFNQNPQERTIIRRNHILGQNSDPATIGIFMNQQNTSDVEINNNYIANFLKGIEVTQTLNDGWLIYNNSIYAQDACLYGYFENDNNIRNNIFYCYGASAGDYCVNMDANATSPTMDYNLFYYTGSAKTGRRSSTDYTTKADWDGLFSSNDLNSVSGDPDFTGATSGNLDIDLTGANQTGMNVGIINLVSDDIYGTLRSNTTNDDIGAFEVPYNYYYVNDGTMDGNEYWCTAIGNDGAGDGTTAAPYLTIEGALSAEALNPGDRIRVDVGTYNDGQVDFAGEGNGTAAAPIVIEGASNLLVTQTSTSGYTFDSDGVDYYRITNMTINNSVNTNIFLSSTSTNWQIDNCIINNTTASQTYMAINDDGGGSHTISENTINAADAIAIQLEGNSNTVEKNKIKTSDIGVVFTNTSGSNTIKNNYITTEEKGLSCVSGTANLIYNNSFYSDQECIDGDLTSYNIRNNILYTSSNTATHYCIDASTDPSTCDFNLYYHPNAAKAGDFQSGADNAALTDIVTNTAFEDDGEEGDPKYADATNGDLALGGGTAAENQGTSIAIVTEDIVGTTRGATPEIGAQEISGGYYYVNDGTYDGNDIYTTAVGTNAASGTSSDPYLTLQEVFDDFDLGAGDTIYVDAGTYDNGLITVGSDDGGVAIRGVDTTKTIIDNTGAAGVLTTNDVDDLHFQDIKFQKSANTNQDMFFVTSNSTGVTLKRCSFVNSGSTHSALIMWGDDNVVEYCTFYAGRDGMYANDGADDNVFRYNYCDLDHNTTYACVSYWGDRASIYNNEMNGGQFGMYIEGSTNDTIYNNYVYAADYAIYTGGGAETNFFVYYNSFYVDKSVITSELNGWDIRNNILYTTSNSATDYCVDGTTANPATLDYNVYYHPNAAQAAFINGTGGQAALANIVANTAFEDNGVEGDPSFNNAASGDLTIEATSNAYQQATPLTSYTTDFRGWTRHASTPTIGAYEPNAAFPLPVELVEVSSVCNDQDEVEIKWVTASELDNDYFTLERSEDGHYYEEVLRLDGAGTSSIQHAYGVRDLTSPEAGAYYRVRQTDYNGQNSVSHRIYQGGCAQSDQKSGFDQVQIQRSSVSFEWDVPAAGDYTMSVTDMAGKIVYQSNLAFDTGVQSVQFPKHPYAKGAYVVQIAGVNTSVSQKLVF